MNNIKITTRVIIYEHGKEVSKTEQSYTENNTGNRSKTLRNMYQKLMDFYSPLATNKVTSFAFKDSYKYGAEFGVYTCTIQHVIGSVTVSFQMAEYLERTK